MKLIEKEPEGGFGGGRSAICRGGEVWYRKPPPDPETGSWTRWYTYILISPPWFARLMRPLAELFLRPRGWTREQWKRMCSK